MTRRMTKKIVLVVLALVAIAIVAAASGLTWAHLTIRRERTPLPAAAAVVGTNSADGPVRISYLNTATQPMPRSAVLDPKRDPHPQEPYVMSHPSFVLEWADGRIVLIDAGMTREEAAAFGRPIERFSGGQPIKPLGSVAEGLGQAAARVQGALFTHLHSDHVGGITALCAGVSQRIHVFQTEAQALRTNHLTRAGLRLLQAASCVQRERLEGAPLMPVSGFPGLFVIAAGGHTPGSQIVVAHMATSDGSRHYVFTGDTANNIDGITFDVPKPALYSLLVVPEDGERLGELRRFLRGLGQHAGVTLLVSHDQRQLERSGVPAWPHLG
ncbi:MAG: MBL fold metallo-hydrolase [Deltaproteobacteria bacterium]|nr:MBL fold metallo-hydrolase [Deltaproteobacteria bacterium]